MILSLQRIQHTNSIGIIGNTKTGTGERKGRQAMYIELKNINKSFGDFQASKEVNFAIEKGKLVGLLGPSGSGKTTILRMLAGLEHQDSGDICINGNVVNDLPSSQRGIGFVFQNYALFPYLTVYDNIAYGLKIQKKDKKFIKQRVTELLDLVGLPGLEKRYPDQLSGGQRQRIALARALAPNPEVLLLDEPFAAIDAKVRQELRTWLRETIDKIGITSIFVTHDQDEAIEVADLIEVTPEHEIVWEYVNPYFKNIGGNFKMNMVYRAYRTPYEWVPQATHAEEVSIEPLDVETFRVPGASKGAGTGKVTVVAGVDPNRSSVTGMNGDDEDSDEERLDFCVASVKKGDLKEE